MVERWRVLPEEFDPYAYWRLTLSTKQDPDNAPPLGPESADRVLAAVGKHFVPLELDSNPIFHEIRSEQLLRHLKWCAIWYRDAVEFSSSKLEKDQIHRLTKIRNMAIRLYDLLSDDSRRFLSRLLPPSEGAPGADVKRLIEAVDRQLAAERESGHRGSYKDSFRDCSAFEWLAGKHLPLVYKHIFCKDPGFSRSASQQPDGPYIRFAEKVLDELKIKNGIKRYSREAIARALSDARAGRARRKRRR